MADILIRIQAWNEKAGGYPVEARLSDGSEFSSATLQLDPIALLEAEHDFDPVAYGMQLFEMLFAGKINLAYTKITGKAEVETGGYLRVRLQIDPGAAELHAVPWERLYHYHRGQEVALAASGLTPFSRFTALEIPLPDPVETRPVKLLFAVANPAGMPFDEIKVEQEVESLLQSLNELRRTGQFHITVMPGRTGLSPDLKRRLQATGVAVVEGPTTPENLLRRLPECHAFHFLGHGSFAREGERGEGVTTLHVESETGGWLRWSDAEIVASLARLAALPYLIFLAACETAKRPEKSENPFVGLGPRLVEAGIPAVVAMQDAVPMPLARTLTGDFYHTLLASGVVDQALNEARSISFSPNTFDWAIPVLFTRLPHGRLFAEAKAQALAAIPAPPPAPQLYGRSAVLDDLALDIHNTRVTALRGPAGVGKTALALAVANHPDVAAAFPDGRAWLPLGPQPDIFGALGRLLMQFGFDAGQFDDADKRADQLRAITGGKNWLLILDDIWQVDDARPFLDACCEPGHALLTTRSAQIASDLHAANHEVKVLQRQAALEMLAGAGDMARQAIDANPKAAGDLIETVGCLPLALHVTGRRLNRQALADGVASAAANLSDALKQQINSVLTLRAAEKRPGLEEAEPSLEAVLDLSYVILSEPAQRAFRRLAVFGAQPLDFDAAAMTAVWEVDDETATELRMALVELGLLERQEAVTGGAARGTARGALRYALHPVVAAFADLRLAGTDDEARAAGLKHAAHYAAIVDGYDEAIQAGQMTYAAPYEWEQVARAVAWLAPQIEEDTECAEALLAFTQKWRNVVLNNYDPRRTQWLELGVAAAKRVDSSWDLANTLQAQGDVYSFMKRNDEALTVYEQALGLFRAEGSRLGEANTLQAQGDVYRFLDRNDEALTVYEQALGLFRAVGSRLGEANVLASQGRLCVLDQPEKGEQLLNQAIILYQTIGDRYSVPAQIGNFGWALWRLGATDRARPYLLRAAELFEDIGLLDYAERHRYYAKLDLPEDQRDNEGRTMNTNLLHFNGIDGDTGSYDLPPMTAEDLVKVIRGEATPENLNELRFRYQRKTAKHLGVIKGDPNKLEEAGWGVIFPQNPAAEAERQKEVEAIREALQPLLRLREQQAGARFAEWCQGTGKGFRVGVENKNKYLARQGMGPGPANPDKVPYYLLIVGSPEDIPYRDQTQLDVDYAVGRIHFETLDEYAAYAANVVAAETGPKKAARKAAFFGVANPGDDATQMSATQLTQPLAKMMRAGHPEWTVRSYAPEQATKAALASLLGGTETPAFLFTSSHGMKFGNGSARQLSHQGALLCQDWPGEAWTQPTIPQDFYFAGDDLMSASDLQGLIAFFFACYGGGTPQYDEFVRQDRPGERPARLEIAPHPFLAQLPVKMLGRSRGALAVVSHVDRAWSYSFNWGKAGAQTTIFESMLEHLLKGYPIGSAIEPFNDRYASLSVMLNDELEEIEFGRNYDPFELAGMWTANNDARGYAIIGDPAVRLPVVVNP